MGPEPINIEQPTRTTSRLLNLKEEPSLIMELLLRAREARRRRIPLLAMDGPNS